MKINVFFTLTLFCFIAKAASPPSSLESAHYGVLVKTTGKNEYVKKYQNDKSFTPASVMKLITTATAIEKLGADFHYMTKLEYTGNIINGVLYGNIVIEGAGDPTLGSHYFYERPHEFLDIWVREIQVLGIDSIAGAVIADASVFDKQVIPNKWIWEDIGNYYGAGCYGLSCFDNKYTLSFGTTQMGEIAPIDSVTPDCKRMTFENYVTGANNNRDNAYIYGSPWCFERQIYGTIPAGRKTFKIKGALPNPPLYLAESLKQKLAENGITTSQKVQVSWTGTANSVTGISIWFSPQLADIIKITNKESNNLFAEHLLKSTFASPTQQATLSSSIDSMMSFWESKGVETKGVKIYDGSGLSRATLLTPDFVVGILDYMSTSPNFESFYKSLAISGVDGTFRYFLNGGYLQGMVHGKSGSMSGVRCYAGFIDKSPNEKYTFCIMVNNFTSLNNEIKKAIEKYLTELLP